MWRIYSNPDPHGVKEVSIDFPTNKYSLTMLEKNVNIESLKLSQCDLSSADELHALFYILQKVNLCHGIELNDKKRSIPQHITLEHSSNSTLYRLRCNTCEAVISWFAVTKTCHRCSSFLGKFIKL
jgi:hypothetical protein